MNAGECQFAVILKIRRIVAQDVAAAFAHVGETEGFVLVQNELIEDARYVS